MKHAVAFGLALALAATPALADVCAWTSPAAAQRGAAMIKVGETIMNFCPGCGDKIATPATVASVSSAPIKSDPTYAQVSVNGKGVDLAYVYIRQGAGTAWANVGALVDCSPDNDSPKTLAAAQVPQ